MTPDVSVVIPVLNGARMLAECLDGLSAQQGAPSCEVIVVDNGSTDGSGDLAARHPAVARVVLEPTRGPYAARNAGIGAASGKIIAFTDADCVPSPRWIAGGAAAVTEGADLVGGAIVQMKRPNPSIWERYDRATYLRQDRFIELDGFAATANLFVRAEVFSNIGTFLPELVASGDVEFGQRATAAGYRLVYSAEASVAHRPRTTLRDTWALHRKLGSGFAELSRHSIRGKPREDPSLNISLGTVVDEVAIDGPRLRHRQLAPVHAVAMMARWVGRLTGRG